MPEINPAHLVKAITIYPGSGEHVYEVQPILKNNIAVNIHNTHNKPDALLSIEQMAQTFPNLKYVSLVVDWFATTKAAGEARIIPKIEFKSNPTDWKVGEYNRSNTEEVLRFANGELTYGGTPTDRSVVELCNLLSHKGYKVMLMPMLMVDDPSLTKPWRGEIKPMGSNPIQEVNHFFNGLQGYNKFILHYASLEYNGVKLKDVIDSFVIGSEFRDLTASNIGLEYPAINQFKTLAAQTKAIVGGDVKLTYSANWGDEYHHQAGRYSMDKLWSDPNIDIVGISAYFPLTENLPQSKISFDKIKQGWSNGEGWDYYLSNNQRMPFNGYDWAWKNVKYWWEHTHYNSGIPTEWVPKSKPIWFTEYGFASIDGTSNNPNRFYDPKSGKDLPNMSNGQPDIYTQSLAIAASETFFREIGLERTYLYAWDIRPYPAFPERCDLWSDCISWDYNHSVNGKIGTVMIEVSGANENPEL